MRNYYGKKVDYYELEYKDLNKNRVPPKLVKLIEITGEKCKLTESEYKQLEELLIGFIQIANQPFIRIGKKSLIGIMLLISPSLLLLIFGFKVLSAVASALIIALFIFSFIYDRINRKTALEKLDALKNNSYAAYVFNSPEKLWSSVHLNDGHEEQDHTEIDNEGNLYDFYIDCGGIVIPVEENLYNAVINRFFIVLFFHEKKTTLEYFSPDA